MHNAIVEMHVLKGPLAQHSRRVRRVRFRKVDDALHIIGFVVEKDPGLLHLPSSSCNRFAITMPLGKVLGNHVFQSLCPLQKVLGNHAFVSPCPSRKYLAITFSNRRERILDLPTVQ